VRRIASSEHGFLRENAAEVKQCESQFPESECCPAPEPDFPICTLAGYLKN
jgi:hypothetical protein